MENRQSALLEFKPEFNSFTANKELRHGLSVAVTVGNSLWLANDETITVERLTLQEESGEGELKYSEHAQFELGKYLTLPAPVLPGSSEFEEADIEGIDCNGGYLWLVTSHSLKRSQPNRKSIEKDFERLAKISSDGNRYLLARIPILKRGGHYTLATQATSNGKKRFAGQIRGGANGNLLTEALMQDKHLHPFMTIPGKDNGFDIEGLAVSEDGRIYLGLRGPVLRGWAVILELQVEADRQNPAELKLKSINPNNPSSTTANPGYRKHFLDLGGLGIRDLCRDQADLLILAGPTLDIDGPVIIYRWKGALQENQESYVYGEALQKIVEIQPDPKAPPGKDRAEGLALLPEDSNGHRSLLVVYDSTSDQRQVGDSSLIADIFILPQVNQSSENLLDQGVSSQ